MGKGPDGRGRGVQGATGQGARKAGDTEQGTESNEAGRRPGGGWPEAGRLAKNEQPGSQHSEGMGSKTGDKHSQNEQVENCGDLWKN